MTGTVIDLTVRSLAGLVDLDIERTKYRGHAWELAASSASELIIVLGGDGSINEVVNGVMSQQAWPRGTGENGAGADGAGGEPRQPPLIAVIPGGGGNVFARALGLPPDAAHAIRKVREIIAAGRYRKLDLYAAPYHLPRDVLYRIPDYVFPYPQRELCVWTRAQVAEAIGEKG